MSSDPAPGENSRGLPPGLQALVDAQLAAGFTSSGRVVRDLQRCVPAAVSSHDTTLLSTRSTDAATSLPEPSANLAAPTPGIRLDADFLLAARAAAQPRALQRSSYEAFPSSPHAAPAAPMRSQPDQRHSVAFPVPTIVLAAGGEAALDAARPHITAAMARDGIVVVKQATWHLGIHDGAMSARELARSAVPGHTIYVLTQPSNPSGFALAPNSVVPMSVGAFLKRQSRIKAVQPRSQDASSPERDDFIGGSAPANPPAPPVCAARPAAEGAETTSGLGASLPLEAPPTWALAHELQAPSSGSDDGPASCPAWGGRSSWQQRGPSGSTSARLVKRARDVTPAHSADSLAKRPRGAAHVSEPGFELAGPAAQGGTGAASAGAPDGVGAVVPSGTARRAARAAAPPDDFTTLPNAKSVFAPNVEDLAVDAVASQLRKLPPWLRWDGSESLLTHAPAPIGGMTTPQLYLKAPGSWTGAHQENLCAASVNISHGPGVSEWAAIPGRAVSRLREAALRDFGFDIWSSEGRYFPPLAWLEEAGIPYTFFRQEPGDMVVLQGDAVHFVSSLGHATHSSWNILTERQLPMAVARTAANVASKQPLVVPLVNLARRWLSSRSDGAAAPVGSLQQADRKPLPIEAASAEVKPQVSHSLLSSAAADASRAGAAQGAPASGGHGAGGDVGGDVGGGGDDDDDDDGLDEDLGLLPTRALPPASVSPVLELLRGGAEEALFDLQPPVLGARASPEPSPAAAASVPIRLAGAIVRGAEHRDVAVARTLAAIPGVAVEAISSERADQVYRCDNLECMAETVFAFASCLVPVLTRRRDKERAKRERSAAAAAKLGADVAPGQWTSGANVDFERSQSRRRWASMKAATESLAPKDRAGRMFRRARDRRATRAPNGVVRPRIMCVTCALTQHVRCGSAVRLYLRHDIAESVGAKPPCDAEPLPSDVGRAQ